MVEERDTSQSLATEEAPPSEAPAPEQVESTQVDEQPESPPTLSDEERLRFVTDYVGSDDFLENEKVREALQREADKRAKTMHETYERKVAEAAAEAARIERQKHEDERRAQLVSSLQQVKKDDPERFLELMENPDYASAWAGAKAPPVVDEASLVGRGIKSAYDSMFGVAHNLPGLRDLSDDEFAGLRERAKATGSQDKAFEFLINESHERSGSKVESKAVEEARTATESQTKAKLRGGEGPDDAAGGAGGGDSADAVLTGRATGETKASAFEKKYGFKPKTPH